jgi:hypothetical protein
MAEVVVKRLAFIATSRLPESAAQQRKIDHPELNHLLL